MGDLFLPGERLTAGSVNRPGQCRGSRTVYPGRDVDMSYTVRLEPAESRR